MTQVLKNKTAIITGASQGLGAQMAHHFVAAGANVMLCARDANTLQTLANELRAQASPYQKIVFHACDVTHEKSPNELVAATLKEMGSLHVLVNNAGIWGPMG